MEVFPTSFGSLSKRECMLVKMISMHHPAVPQVRKLFPNRVLIRNLSDLYFDSNVERRRLSMISMPVRGVFYDRLFL